jgi:hypothetical protein
MAFRRQRHEDDRKTAVRLGWHTAGAGPTESRRTHGIRSTVRSPKAKRTPWNGVASPIHGRHAGADRRSDLAYPRPLPARALARSRRLARPATRRGAAGFGVLARREGAAAVDGPDVSRGRAAASGLTRLRAWSRGHLTECTPRRIPARSGPVGRVGPAAPYLMARWRRVRPRFGVSARADARRSGRSSGTLPVPPDLRPGPGGPPFRPSSAGRLAMRAAEPTRMACVIWARGGC